MDKTCTTRVVPFSIGEYMFEKKNRCCAMCISNFHRLGLALAGNPLDYSSHKEIVCNHFVGLLLYVQRKIRFYEWSPCLLTLQVLYW